MIWATVPKLNLHVHRNDIVKVVKDELEKAMSAYGYEIVHTWILDIETYEHVKRNMNEMDTAARMRAAANEKAEVENILHIRFPF